MEFDIECRVRDDEDGEWAWFSSLHEAMHYRAQVGGKIECRFVSEWRELS